MNTALLQQNTHSNTLNNQMNAYRDVFEQFVDNAAFLWVLRSIAVEQPHYNAEDLNELEQRIESQLDGLMTAVEDAWDICLKALELEEPGEVFTAAVIAFRSHDVTKIQKAVEVGLSNDEAAKGLISAMGWLPGKLVHPWVEKFFTSKDLNHKYLALAACSVRRENPGGYLSRILARDDCKQHEKLYVRALRLIGEIRRLDLIQHLNEAINSDNEDIKFWSNWSSILLGNRTAVNNLESFVLKTGSHQFNAINIVFRVLPIEQARSLITKLAEDNAQIRTVIKATGILGDPHAVNWLISMMNNASLARLSAEAMSVITGIDLDEYNSVLETPPEIPQQPDNEIEDDDVSMDEDENLLWPDAKKVSQIWVNQSMKFIAGQRYFAGQTISLEVLSDKIANAYQRQRHAAAMELALMSTSMPLQNTRARVKV